MRSYSVRQQEEQQDRESGELLKDVLFIGGIIALCVGAAFLFIA